MSLNANIRISDNIVYSKDGVDLSTPSEDISVSISKSSVTGKVYHDQYTLSANEVYQIDLGDSSLQDVYGQNVALLNVTSFYVKANANNGGDLTVSGTTNAFLPTLPALGADEGIGFACDIDVSVNSDVTIVNGATSGLVDIIVTGTE